jgi:hypothetical protein
MKVLGKALCSAALLLMWAGPAQAANWYVRPNGGTYGSETGKDWSNAFDGFSGIAWNSIAAGDTIWVAGGNYTQKLTPGKSGTSSAPIAIRRARGDSSACTGAAGWSSSFDTTVHQVKQGFMFNSSSYVTISGRTTTNGGANGWYIDFLGTTSGPAIEWPNGASSSNVLIEYLHVQGPGEVTYSSDGRGIDDTPFSSASNHTFSHMEIHGWESGAYVAGASNVTFEWIDMYDIMAANWSTFHPNGIYTSGAPNGIVRYSKFHKGPDGNGVGEGIFFEQSGGSTNWQIYGNVFYDLDQSGWKAIEITSAVGAIKVYNNTFDNILVGSLYTSNSSSCSGGEWKNNVLYKAGNNTCGTASNNVTVSAATAFVNRTAHDYHIVATTGTGFARNAGTALSANGYFNVDGDGNARGGDGSWDAGAFEYGSGGGCTGSCGTPAPGAPSNVRIIIQ